MSKNSTLADSVNSTFQIDKDENFKDVIRYKGIAAIIIKLTIPEFYDKTLVEISRAIIDGTRKRQPNMSNTSILEDEIDFLPTEAGTKDEKNTINDAVFRVRLNNEISKIELKCIDKEITVNTEMQKETKGYKLGYNIISRAVYYGASLLRDTVPAGDRKYVNIHKVYTIWFCRDNLALKEYKETTGKYIHRYGFRRFYDDVKDKVAPAEKEADLIEVVLVELNKIKTKDNDAARLLYKLFFDTQNLVNEIETQEKVNLTKIRKGVQTMIDYDARLKEAMEEAEARKKEAVKEAEARTREAMKKEVEARTKEVEEKTEARTREVMKKEAKNLKEKGYSNEQILEQLGLA